MFLHILLKFEAIWMRLDQIIKLRKCIIFFWNTLYIDNVTYKYINCRICTRTNFEDRYRTFFLSKGVLTPAITVSSVSIQVRFSNSLCMTSFCKRIINCTMNGCGFLKLKELLKSLVQISQARYLVSLMGIWLLNFCV